MEGKRRSWMEILAGWLVVVIELSWLEPTERDQVERLFSAPLRARIYSRHTRFGPLIVIDFFAAMCSSSSLHSFSLFSPPPNSCLKN